MKKIMFIIGSLSGGGAERIVTQVASFFAEKKDYDVTVLTYYKLDSEYEYSPKIKRINISGGDLLKFNRMSVIKKVINIRKEVKSSSPDDIICFLPHPFVFACLSLMFTKYYKRIVYAERANPNYDNSRIGKLRNFFVKKIRRIIVQNNGQRRHFSKFVKGKIYKIPNFIPEELFVKKKNYLKNPKKIVSVGRLTNQKNYELAIQSFYEIQKKYADLEYYIYGKGPQEIELVTLVKSLGIENKVYFMGFELNREHIFLDKDIYLMTSKYEGMPNTLAEAMCYGIPSISTNCDFGPSDLILDSSMGILLNDFEVSSCVSALEQVIENYKDFILKAISAKEKIYEKYNLDKIMNKWVSFFENKE